MTTPSQPSPSQLATATRIAHYNRDHTFDCGVGEHKCSCGYDDLVNSIAHALADQAATHAENERLAFERLSMALTKGNAATWDQLFHAAESQVATHEAERAELQARYDALLKAGEDGARMDASTDERCVGWYRDMALPYWEADDDAQ